MTSDDFHNTVKLREHKVQNFRVKVFQFAAEEVDFSFSEVSWPVVGPNQTPFQWTPALFPPYENFR
jgi:hypothetical protein